MFQHNILIAIRNLRRHKGSFFINLIGLSSGLACTLFIFLWVNDELSVDKFHKNDKVLYQVMELSTENGAVLVHESTQGPLSAAMATDLPEVERAVSVMPMEKFGIKLPLKAGDNVIRSSGMFAGKEFFNMFSYRLLIGSPDQVLQKKESIVLSETLAKNLFGSIQQAMGQQISWELMGNKFNTVVTGVFSDPPANSSMKFSYLLTFDVLYYDFAPNLQKWWNEGPYTYLMVKQGTDINNLNAKVENFIRKYLPDSHFTLFLRSFSNGYLYGKYENGVQSGGRIDYVRLFSIVAVFILVIACINFMNLSTARASRRLKEVGIKKAVGSTRSALIYQFLSEAVLMSMISLVVAVIFVALLLPLFNDLTGKQLQLNFDLRLISIALGVALITGFVSGSYPAFYMSGFNVVSVFRGTLKKSIGELLARKGLVVFQFMVSLMLIVAVMVIYRQIEYVQSKNIGYDRDNIIQFDREGKIHENPSAFMAEMKKIPGVMSVAMMQESIFQNRGGSSTYGIQWPGKGEEELVDFVVRAVDYGVLETLGIKIKEGRSFSKEYGLDRSMLIFNETAINIMGLKNPVGTKVNMWGNEMVIGGVVKDFHVSTFHEKIEPMVFRYNPEGATNVIAKIESGKERETVAAISALYKRFNPGYVFEFSFLDEQYQQQYLSEQRISALSRCFAGLAIIISCLGLFGLAAFNAEVRTKEIGIRKVLGASVLNLMVMLSKDFVKLTLIAMFIAFPLSWWAMNKWLDGFAYRVEIGLTVFIVAGLFMLVLAMVTVGYQSIKSALINPVKSLRSE